MKDEILLESFGKYIQNIPFFKDNFSKSTLEKLSLSLKELSFSPEEIIFHVLINFFLLISYILKEGQNDEKSLYIVNKGILEEIILNPKNNKVTSLRKLEVI